MRIQNIAVLAVLVSSFLGSVFAQEKTRAYLVNPDLVGIVTASGSDCPIELGDEKVLVHENGLLTLSYTVRNRSSSPVVSFQIRELSWLGGQESIVDNSVAKDQKFLPNESFSTFSLSEGNEISAFDDRLRTHDAFRNRPKDIWLIIVTRVETSDGEIYDASSSYIKLVEFVETLDVSLEDSAEQIRRKEDELRTYVKRLFHLDRISGEGRK
ncbi:MAG TPA: hypothetical protein PKE66_11365 [Pyrinomonadaceae bacterium]|nr:hypothetical protein [Pyrinomonadaceae bacterium]